MFGRWKRREKHRADKQQGDPDALARAGDPRGGLQDEAYRQADPRDPVEAESTVGGVGSTEPESGAAGSAGGGAVLSGPGGAPQEDPGTEERRRRDR